MLSSMVAQPAYNPGGPSVTAGKTNHLCLLPVGPSCTLSWPPDEPRAEGDRMRSQMVADGRLRCDSLLLCALFSIIYLVVISWAFGGGAFCSAAPRERNQRFLSLGTFSSLSGSGPKSGSACKEQVKYRPAGMIWHFLWAAMLARGWPFVGGFHRVPALYLVPPEPSIVLAKENFGGRILAAFVYLVEGEAEHYFPHAVAIALRLWKVLLFEALKPRLQLRLHLCLSLLL